MCRSSAGSRCHLLCISCGSSPSVIEARIPTFDRTTTRLRSWCSGFKRDSIRAHLCIDSKGCAAAPLALLSSLTDTLCHAPPSAVSRGVDLSIEPLHARGGGVVASLEPPTLGYWLVRHGDGWLCVVCCVRSVCFVRAFFEVRKWAF